MKCVVSPVGSAYGSEMALRYTFQHAATNSVELEMRHDVKYFRLQIRDDGEAIDPGVPCADGIAWHEGSRRTGSRQAHNWTELASGTEIELAIPAAKATPTPMRFIAAGNANKQIADRGSPQGRSQEHLPIWAPTTAPRPQ